MSPINIMLFRTSLFYAPIMVAAAGPFLRNEGLEPTLSAATADRTVRGSLLDGTVDVGQGAVSQSWPLIEKGVDPGYYHFAQVNCRDGFFLVGRGGSQFSWSDLAGAKVLVDHGAQPLAAFKYACLRQGVSYDSLVALDAGGEPQMIEAFSRGEADYVHLQAPGAQVAAAGGGARIVASVGEAIGPIAFTSLMATRSWLEGPVAPAFMRGMAKAMSAMVASTPQELAALVRPFFPQTGDALLRESLAAYQQLGTWSGGLGIRQDEYDVAQEAFLHAGVTTRSHPFAEVVSPAAFEVAT